MCQEGSEGYKSQSQILFQCQLPFFVLQISFPQWREAGVSIPSTPSGCAVHFIVPFVLTISLQNEAHIIIRTISVNAMASFLLSPKWKPSPLSCALALSAVCFVYLRFKNALAFASAHRGTAMGWIHEALLNDFQCWHNEKLLSRNKAKQYSRLPITRTKIDLPRIPVIHLP